jgi:hypothetical protein
MRGLLTLGTGPQDVFGFIWAPPQGKLYLDLNRNGDLTDDVSGVYNSFKSALSPSFRAFTNIQLQLTSKQGAYPVLIELNLSQSRAHPFAFVGLRSFWHGKVTLDGRDWQVGVVETGVSNFGATQTGYLVIRPWASRTEPLTMQDVGIQLFPFTQNIFLQQRAYHLDCTFEARAGQPVYALRLQEVPAKLGEVEFAGKSVRRCLLIGKSYTAVLDAPQGVMRVPIGTYNQQQIYLKEGGGEAVLETPGWLTVEDGKRVPVKAGGPLTNSVAVRQQGRLLVLDYSLVGADGSRYRLLRQDRTKPPRFTIYGGGKELDSGQFEFG